MAVRTVPLHARPAVRRVLRLAAVLGVALGVETTILHLATDPMADVRAYYDAGARLNAGQPLYVQDATTDEPAFYRYPPLLAIAFRPLALLPYEAALAIWIVLLVAVTGLTAWRLGISERALLVAGWLALPIMWALTIGQAQVLVTALLAFGSPAAVALAGHLKLFPALAAVYWLGRRDWRALGAFALWAATLTLVQLVLEPTASLAYLGFLSLEQVGEVANVSPYAISPVLWVATGLVLLLLALRFASTSWGWLLAVAVAVFATPRLLVYQLSTLLAGLGGPREGRNRSGTT